MVKIRNKMIIHPSEKYFNSIHSLLLSKNVPSGFMQEKSSETTIFFTSSHKEILSPNSACHRPFSPTHNAFSPVLLNIISI